MSDKKKILLLHRAYPVSISKYFLAAFRHRDDVEVVDVSPDYGTSIPWKGGMHLPEKYKSTPSYSLPFDYPEVPWPIVDNLTGHQEWDMILTIDPAIRWSARPAKNCPVVHVGTDPHVINYDKPREYSDFFFNMQAIYSHPDDIYLPYAFSKYHFSPPTVVQEKEWDASIVGLQYDKRVQWATSLRNSGYRVFSDTGPAFDEYRDITWKSRVALSWSSKEDLICRVFEAMAMMTPLVSNYVPDMDLIFGKQRRGEYLVTFDGKSPNAVLDATAKVIDIIKNPDDYKMMAADAERLVWDKHTFDHRVDHIMQKVFGE